MNETLDLGAALPVEDLNTLAEIGSLLSAGSSDPLPVERTVAAVLSAACRSWRHSGGKAASFGLQALSEAAEVSYE